MSLLSQEMLLPITQSGLNFFQDAFFEQRRRHFQMALKEITDRHGFTSPDLLSSYRSLRQRDLKQENQAVSVIDQHNAREITLDVKDFKDGDLSVKAEGHSVEVEGRVEKKEGNSISTHSFHRRFSLPSSVDMSSVTSTVSSDGILTISAPKKNRPEVPSEFNIPIENRTTTDVKGKTQNTCSEKESAKTQTKAETMTCESTSTSSCTSASSADTVEKGNQSKERSNTVVEPVTPLPLMLRGSFFEDSFFRHAHRDFVTAVESILKKSGAPSSTAEDFKHYKSLRDVDFSNKTQAYTLSEDDSSYKIVLDAQDFKNGDVQMKVVGETLVVEGRAEKKIDDSVSNITFQRRFALPCNTKASDITAAMSSDGVLTILAKKCDSHKEAEHIIPIQLETTDKEPSRRHIGKQQEVQGTETSQKSRSVGQQTSINETPQQQQLLQQQEQQLQQQAQQIHKQENVISIQEDQITQQEREIERQKTYNQKLQRDAEQQQIQINNENAEEKERNQARHQQRLFQEKEQQLQEQEKQKEQKVPLQQEHIRQQDNERLKAHNEKLERNTEQVQNRSKKQNQEKNQQKSSIQMCMDDTPYQSNKPVWTPKIGSLETGFYNFKRFQCSGDENLPEKASSSVHKDGNDSVLKEKISYSNKRAEKVPEPAAGTQVPTVQADVSLPVERRGNFFQDSFFSNDHKHFQAAVSKVLERFGVTSTNDDLKAYRTLRQSISVEESQAAQITDEETNYKVVLDVYDFVGGDVNVKAEGQMLVVEGQTQKKEGISTSSRSFRRCFALPTLVDMEAVTSALSSDGVLTITAPKKDQGSIGDPDASLKVKKELSQTSQKMSGNKTKGWREQTAYHESSFGRGAGRQTS